MQNPYYIPRKLSVALKTALARYPVVAVFGPRQSGKTTFVRAECDGFGYADLEDPDTRHSALNDPKAFLAGLRRPAILDEIQRAPELLHYIELLLGQDERAGSYVMTSRQSRLPIFHTSKTLSERIGSLTLLPFSMEELDGRIDGDSRETMLRRGFLPRVFGMNDEPIGSYREYYRALVGDDLRALIATRNPSAFEAFMRLLAGHAGQLFNASSLAEELGVSYKTIQHWVALLKESHVVFELKPYHSGFGRRLVKSPKVYFVEPGLACYLLGMERDDQVVRDPSFVGLFENMVVVEALKARLNRGISPSLYFMRDSNGVEVDLVLDRNPAPLLADIKASTSFHSEFRKGLLRFGAVVGSADGYVVYGGDDTIESRAFRLVGYKRTAAIFSQSLG